MSKPIVMLAAGGTGGHVFPAEALAHELIARGYEVHLITDSRAERYAGTFPAAKIHIVPSATIGSKNPISVARSLLTLVKGISVARKLIRQLKPIAVVGFGGYPTLPPLYAATRESVPTLIHEQNAVMGRANRLLAPRVKAIAGGFLSANSGEHRTKIIATGNPVRPAVLEAAKIDYQASTGDAPFNLVVFGGSQGAQFFSAVLPEAISLLPQQERSRLRLTQQARADDLVQATEAYKTMGIAADVSPFFGDMAERIGNAHFVISRSGASTVSELSVIGRPSVLVPYPYALDHDQAANAAMLEAEGGASVKRQSELSPKILSDLLLEAMNSPDHLAASAAAAKRTGKPHAAQTLANLVDYIAAGRPVADFAKEYEGVHP
jgi:UDP-N-acetylglucosamine--N-acetylmuramyl-(pentapeptide) pyrophosphoryl-undecaprenol N-acetylglucosamine transferase